MLREPPQNISCSVDNLVVANNKHIYNIEQTFKYKNTVQLQRNMWHCFVICFLNVTLQVNWQKPQQSLPPFVCLCAGHRLRAAVRLLVRRPLWCLVSGHHRHRASRRRPPTSRDASRQGPFQDPAVSPAEGAPVPRNRDNNTLWLSVPAASRDNSRQIAAAFWQIHLYLLISI